MPHCMVFLIIALFSSFHVAPQLCPYLFHFHHQHVLEMDHFVFQFFKKTRVKNSHSFEIWMEIVWCHACWQFATRVPFLCSSLFHDAHYSVHELCCVFFARQCGNVFFDPFSYGASEGVVFENTECTYVQSASGSVSLLLLWCLLQTIFLSTFVLHSQCVLRIPHWMTCNFVYASEGSSVCRECMCCVQYFYERTCAQTQVTSCERGSSMWWQWLKKIVHNTKLVTYGYSVIRASLPYGVKVENEKHRNLTIVSFVDFLVWPRTSLGTPCVTRNFDVVRNGKQGIENGECTYRSTA